MDCSRARTRDPIEWLEMCPEISGPIVSRLREWVLEWEPDLTESIKWNMLCFSSRKLVFGLSACKAHAGVTFFRGAELADPRGLLAAGTPDAQIRTARFTDLEDLPRSAFRALVRAAVVQDSEPPLPARPRREPLPIPDFLAVALRAKPKAEAGFRSLAPSCQREYIVWVRSAKRPETRERRLRETLAAVERGWKWEHRHGKKVPPGRKAD